MNLNASLNILRKTILNGNFLLLFLYGCSMPTEPQTLEVTIKHNLSVEDEMPVLKLEQDRWQTIHMLDIEVSVNGEPFEYADIDFHSNLYWFVNDTMSYGKRDCLGCDIEIYGIFTENDYSPVPTSNSSSLTDDEGKTRNAIAPVRIMSNDTMVIWIDVYAHGVGHKVETLKIKLEK